MPGKIDRAALEKDLKSTEASIEAKLALRAARARAKAKERRQSKGKKYVAPTFA